VPGVLPAWAPINESHVHGLLEHPHYTRPAEFHGWRVPDVLLNGNHADIERWRREQSELITAKRKALASSESGTPDADGLPINPSTDEGSTTHDERPLQDSLI
jgi:tRNA G37 N-methylase TrmD